MAKLRRIVDVVARKAAIVLRIAEIFRPQADLPLVGGGLRLGEGESFRDRVVAILLEEPRDFRVDDQSLAGRERRLHDEAMALGDGLLSVERERVQIVSREVGSEIRAVSPDGAVLHQAVAEKDLLAEPRYRRS